MTDRSPNPRIVAELLGRPWTIETGVHPDGAAFARCVEMPDVVAHTPTPEHLDALFWDAMRAAIEERLWSGEAVPAPKFALPAPAPEHLLFLVPRLANAGPTAERRAPAPAASVSAAPFMPTFGESPLQPA